MEKASSSGEQRESGGGEGGDSKTEHLWVLFEVKCHERESFTILEHTVNPKVDLKCMGPAAAQLLKHPVGFVVSWLLDFGVVNPKNRPGRVPGSILSDLGSAAGSVLKNIPEAEQGPRSIFQLLGPSWTPAGSRGPAMIWRHARTGLSCASSLQPFVPRLVALGDQCVGYVTVPCSTQGSHEVLLPRWQGGSKVETTSQTEVRPTCGPCH